MSNPKGVTIRLTDKQRHQIRTATGQDHAEIRIERQALGGDAASTSREMAGIVAGKRVFGGRSAGRSLGIKAGGKSLGIKAGGRSLGIKAGGRSLGIKAGGRSLGVKAGGKRIR